MLRVRVVAPRRCPVWLSGQSSSLGRIMRFDRFLAGALASPGSVEWLQPPLPFTCCAFSTTGRARQITVHTLSPPAGTYTHRAEAKANTLQSGR
ncbi:hypothetical protein KC363_g165 [Hortaea werneckii]|nr:hypothetical protein KC363_g165 [Hortaea werneckii]